MIWALSMRASEWSEEVEARSLELAYIIRALNRRASKWSEEVEARSLELAYMMWAMNELVSEWSRGIKARRRNRTMLTCSHKCTVRRAMSKWTSNWGNHVSHSMIGATTKEEMEKNERIQWKIFLCLFFVLHAALFIACQLQTLLRFISGNRVLMSFLLDISSSLRKNTR